jgi:hypothetical protein
LLEKSIDLWKEQGLSPDQLDNKLIELKGQLEWVAEGIAMRLTCILLDPTNTDQEIQALASALANGIIDVNQSGPEEVEHN